MNLENFNFDDLNAEEGGGELITQERFKAILK